jgi:[acyl-carrier-protein] S-malonyltransferase
VTPAVGNTAEKRKGIDVTLAYMFAGGMALEAPGDALYERYPVMREWIDQVGRWTGLSRERLLTEDFSPVLRTGEPAPADVRFAAEARQAAGLIGVADVLADLGLRPGAVGGSSLGLMVAACVAGSIDRRDLFEIIRLSAYAPHAPEGEPERGIGMTVVSSDAETERFLAQPDVYLGAEVGEMHDGSRMLLLSGYLDALQRLAGSEPAGKITVLSTFGGGHSPLQQFMADLQRPLIEKIEFRDPSVALFTALSRRQLTTGAEVREEFLVNPVRSTYMSNVVAGLHENGTQLGLMLGVASAVAMFKFPFPVLQALTPEDIAQITTTVFELGIETG